MSERKGKDEGKNEEIIGIIMMMMLMIKYNNNEQMVKRLSLDDKFTSCSWLLD